MSNNEGKSPLRSQSWFNDPHNPGMTALYIERYMNYGITREELQSGQPICRLSSCPAVRCWTAIGKDS